MSKTAKPHIFIDHLVDVCRDGQGEFGVQRVRLSVRSLGFTADMPWLIYTICVISSLLLGSVNLQAGVQQVCIIAESVSTRTEANRIIQEKGWNIVPIDQAQYALVVVRSDLENPLIGPYKTIFDLQRDATNQLDSGDNFVVYLFALSTNSSWIAIELRFYPAKQ
jgi:hypothetical protein